MKTKNNLGYLLTSYKGYPIIIKLKSKNDLHKFGDKVKGRRVLSEACALKTIKSGRWVQDASDEVCYIINEKFGDQDIWIQAEDSGL